MRLSFRYFLFLLIASVVKGDFLNDYLNDKVFGVDPGPCPSAQEKCVIDLSTADFPPSIGNIRFCLFRILFIDLFCDELKDWVQSGTVEIFQLQCQNVAVDNVEITQVFEDADTIITNFDVDRARLACNGRVNIIDTVLAGRVRIGVNAQTTFTTNGNRNGVSLDFNLRLEAAGGFAENLVDRAEVENCAFDADLGLRVSNTNAFSISILGSRPFGLTIFEDAVINLVLRILEAAIGNILCQIAEQAGTLNDGTQGILNERLDELNTRYDELIQPVTIDIAATDSLAVSDPDIFGATPEEIGLALNLADSNGLEIVSVTLNDFLGDPTVDPLRINQAVNLVTDPDGEFFFDFTQNEEALSTTFPIDFTDVTFTLQSARIVGLNTIKSLKFLDNDFSENGNGLQFTLTHDFEIDNFQFLFTIETVFKRGEWVTRSSCSANSSPNVFLPESQCTSDQERFTFDFGLTVDDIVFSAATLTAFNFLEIQEIQIGQIFDKELSDFFAATRSILDCIAPSVYIFEFSDLLMSIQGIRDPVVNNFSGPGVDDLVRNSINIIDTLARNVLANDLPFLMRGPVRDGLNEFLRTDIADVETLINCQPYVQIPSFNPYLNFSEPPINAFFPIINDVLGDFSAGSDVDLNDFIQIVGEYYADNAEDFPLQPGAQVGDWVTKPDLIPLSSLKAFDQAFADAENAFINVNEVRVLNLNTINKFQSDAATQDQPQGFSVEIGFLNDPAQALELAFGFHIFSTALGNNEKFDFTVSIEGIDFNVFVNELLVNLDSIQRLTLQQTTHLPCIQSTIDGFDADIARSSATAENIQFDIIFDPAENSNSPLRAALELLDNEFTNRNTRFTRLSNYLFEIGFESGLAGLEESNFSLTPEICSGESTDLSFVISAFTGLAGFNTTFFNEQCLKEPALIAEIGDFEFNKFIDANEDPNEFFKWTENIFIDLLSGFLDVSSGDETEDIGTVQSLLFTFAEAEGNFLVDLFQLEENENGNATVTLQIPLNEDNVFLRLFGIEPLSISNDDQFLAEVQFLRIKEIDKFLNQLRLFQTVGDYTLRHSIGFSDEDVLKLELVALLQVNAEIVDQAPPGTPPIRETIVLEADLAGATIDLEMFSALKKDLFKQLSVSHFLTVNEAQEFGIAETAFDCLLNASSRDLIEIRELNVNFASIGTPVITTEGNQLISEGVEAVLEEVTSVLLQFYADAVTRISQTCLREFANDELRKQVELAEGLCPREPAFTDLSEANELFRFSDSSAYGEFQDFLKEVMYVDNFEVLNLFIEGVTAEEFFDTNIFSSKFELSYKNVDYGALEINITRLLIEGLNTMTEFKFFEPVSRNGTDFNEDDDPFSVVLTFRHAGPTTYNTREVITGFDFFVLAPVVTNDISLDFTFTNFFFSLEMILALNLNSLMRIQFDQVDTFEEFPCLFTPVRRLDIVDFEIQVDAIEVTFDCAGDCDAPLLNQLAGGPESFSSDNTEELADLFQSGIAFAVRYLESSPAQQLINVAIETSETNCDAIIEGVEGFLVEGEPDGDVFFPLLYVCIFILFLLGIGIVMQYPKHKKRLAERIREFEEKEERKFDMNDEITIFANEMRALAWSPVVPVGIRIFEPILCMFNIIGLTWGVTTQGALTILLTFTIVGLEMTTIDLVPFTIISTVNDLWFSGGWYLSIMIVGFSFLWPIVKNIGLLYLWYTPGTVLTADSRSSWLEFLDVMGKWSFVDVFVVVMTLAALQTSISLSQNEELSFLDPTFFQTFVTMKPEIGIVMLSVVSVLSLVANHIMTFYNRKTIAHYKKEYDRISGNTAVPARAQKKKNMQKYKFAGRATNTKKMKLLIALNIVSGLLTIVGVFAPVVIFELRGVVAILLNEIAPDEVNRPYSVFSLGILLFEAAPEGFDEQIVIALFVFLYFAVSIIGPFLQIIVLHIIMTKKFNLANFSTMIYIVMLVSFWTSLDVVLIGVGATLLQITNVTDFIINFITNDVCANIQGVLVTFVPDEQNDSCLEIVGFWGYGAIPLLFGTIGQLAAHGMIMVMATRMKQDWYYFAYVLHGHRKNESKPKKLTYFRDRVYKYFTFPSRKRNREQPAAAEEVVNPRFTAKSAEIVRPSANFSEGLSGSDVAPADTESQNVFAAMEDVEV